jgi:hypothetical protein
MTGRKRLGLAAALVVAAYLAYPYATLYWLSDAIRRGDPSALETLVDWEQVREGIKEDICDTVFDDNTEPAPQAVATAGTKLPPFGFSFVRGIASNAIDEAVTPQNLVSAARARAGESAEGADASSPVRVTWAFFDTPTEFRIVLQPAANPARAPIALRMNLKHGRWEITRVWLPPEMLQQTNART